MHKSSKFLQRDLDKLEQWSRKWLLRFNEVKRKIMYFGRDNPEHKYKIGTTELKNLRKRISECTLQMMLSQVCNVQRQPRKQPKLWALLKELFHISTVQVSLLYTKPM